MNLLATFYDLHESVNVNRYSKNNTAYNNSTVSSPEQLSNVFNIYTVTTLQRVTISTRSWVPSIGTREGRLSPEHFRPPSFFSFLSFFDSSRFPRVEPTSLKPFPGED